GLREPRVELERALVALHGGVALPQVLLADAEVEVGPGVRGLLARELLEDAARLLEVARGDGVGAGLEARAARRLVVVQARRRLVRRGGRRGRRAAQRERDAERERCACPALAAQPGGAGACEDGRLCGARCCGGAHGVSRSMKT